MKRGRFALLILVSCFLLLAASAGPAAAGCKDLNLVQKLPRTFLKLFAPKKAAAAQGDVTIQWFGHSYFQITTSQGTRIATDPFGFIGYPIPEIYPHVITIGREHPNHNSAHLVGGRPPVLRGLAAGGTEWNRVDTHVRDTHIFNIPIYQRGFEGQYKGSAFVFEVDDLCIAHLGDLGSEMNEDQLAALGKVDVVLIPIGGRYTMDPITAKEVMAQIKAKIAIPMHYYDSESLLAEFLKGNWRSVRSDSDTLVVNKKTLPPRTEVIALRRR
ncbi:MAG: MBL fold metallo-hydrolase [Candidatus Tectomicrobia bacterium]|uniref:MBL fold metallo-hydrolase n=1 Tax=Tectimicrobiota bacterium TaxID=2528274 RepID=A0A932M0P9_UNCTE|nr:MBL fold metallo-hydrolase [Candidatus Tectomicrobia bacterium]